MNFKVKNIIFHIVKKNINLYDKSQVFDKFTTKKNHKKTRQMINLSGFYSEILKI